MTCPRGAITDALCLPCRTGDLRFNLPVAVDSYNGTHSAEVYGHACPQQSMRAPSGSDVEKEAIYFILNWLEEPDTQSSEDCEFCV